MNTHKDLKVLEKANYQSLDEKRLTIDAYLANAIQELSNRVDNLYGKMDYLYEQGKEQDQEPTRCPRCNSIQIRKRDTEWFCQDCAHMWVTDQEPSEDWEKK
jgi:hypothetical protein